MTKIAILHEGVLDKKVIEGLIKHIGLDEKLIVFYPMGVKSNFFDKKHPAYISLSLSVENDEINKFSEMLL